MIPRQYDLLFFGGTYLGNIFENQQKIGVVLLRISDTMAPWTISPGFPQGTGRPHLTRGGYVLVGIVPFIDGI